MSELKLKPLNPFEGKTGVVPCFNNGQISFMPIADSVVIKSNGEKAGRLELHWKDFELMVRYIREGRLDIANAAR